jgi:hypothetical protein
VEELLLVPLLVLEELDVVAPELFDPCGHPLHEVIDGAVLADQARAVVIVVTEIPRSPRSTRQTRRGSRRIDGGGPIPRWRVATPSALRAAARASALVESFANRLGTQALPNEPLERDARSALAVPKLKQRAYGWRG